MPNNQTIHSDARERGARVSPDRPWVGVGAIALVTVIMLASMTFSFTALTLAAEWTWNQEWSFPLVPVFIDGVIIAYTVTYSVFRWRGQPAKRTLILLIGCTTLSCAINVVHAGSGWQWDMTNVQAWTGMAIAGFAPFAALLAAEEVTRLAFIRHEDAIVLPEAQPVAEPAVTGEMHNLFDQLPGREGAPDSDEPHPVLELPAPRRPRQPLLTFASGE